MELLVLISGVVIPPFIDPLAKRFPKEWQRIVTALIVCVVYGGYLAAPLLGAKDNLSVMGVIGIIFTESYLAFKLLWKNNYFRQFVISSATPDEQKVIEDVATNPDALSFLGVKPTQPVPEESGRTNF